MKINNILIRLKKFKMTCTSIKETFNYNMNNSRCKPNFNLNKTQIMGYSRKKS